jgi:hypothetical protein
VILIEVNESDESEEEKSKSEITFISKTREDERGGANSPEKSKNKTDSGGEFKFFGENKN